MSRYNRSILAVVLGLGLLIVALSVASARLGPTIDSFSTATLLDGTLVNSQIAITFTQPMDIPSVEHSFSLNPRVVGDFTWSGNQMRFIPKRDLSYSTTYRVTIGTGARDRDGHHLQTPYRASVKTEGEHFLYMGTAGAHRDRLVLTSVSGESRVVGPAEGRVSDYSPSFDRSLVVYVKRGAPAERADELWLLSLVDNSTQRIFRRQDWDIAQPHFSPDNHYIVFLASNVNICRRYYGCYRDSRPEVFLYDVRARTVLPFRASNDVPITNFVDFSPHGQIAFTDLGSALTLANPDGTHILHIPNAGNSLEYIGFDLSGEKVAFVGSTPQSTGGDVIVYWSGKYLDVSRGVYDSSQPAFSSRGNRIAYCGYRGERGIEPIYGINLYDFSGRTTVRLTSSSRASDWSPVWSPDDRYIAFVRSEPREAMYMGSGAVWVMKSSGTDAKPVGAAGRNPQPAL